MAPWISASSRFRGCGSVVSRLAESVEAVDGVASGDDGTVVAASFLRASLVLLRRSYPDGQCNDVEQMATVCASEHDLHGDVDHRKNILEERGQARTSTERTKLFRARHRNNGYEVMVAEPSSGASRSIPLAAYQY